MQAPQDRFIPSPQTLAAKVRLPFDRVAPLESRKLADAAHERIDREFCELHEHEDAERWDGMS